MAGGTPFVIRASVGGLKVIVSMECRDRARPADVGWVEQMHGKHSSLPTNTLVLVSNSGFTEAAEEKARNYGFEVLMPKALPEADPQLHDGADARRAGSEGARAALDLLGRGPAPWIHHRHAGRPVSVDRSPSLCRRTGGQGDPGLSLLVPIAVLHAAGTG
jgi:hypothetical protein